MGDHIALLLRLPEERVQYRMASAEKPCRVCAAWADADRRRAGVQGMHRTEMHSMLQGTCGTVTRPVVCLTSVSSLGYCPRSISSYAISASSSAVFACMRISAPMLSPSASIACCPMSIHRHIYIRKDNTRG